jgi:hypothetical protein
MNYPLFYIFFFSLLCCKSFGQTKKDSLYVFVGEKVEVSEVSYPSLTNSIDTLIENGDTTYRKLVSLNMDSKFLARYKVRQVLYGSYASDTIEFVAYDHYGTPAFSKYQTVLLYVQNYNGRLVHQKYQYADVYKTKSGRWASTYKAEDYKHEFNQTTTVKPEKIDFLEKVAYDIKGRGKQNIEEWFPSPFYKIKRNKAIAVYGNYVEELFELKKHGVLKARGIFD